MKEAFIPLLSIRYQTVYYKYTSVFPFQNTRYLTVQYFRCDFFAMCNSF